MFSIARVLRESALRIFLRANPLGFHLPGRMTLKKSVNEVLTELTKLTEKDYDEKDPLESCEGSIFHKGLRSDFVNSVNSVQLQFQG